MSFEGIQKTTSGEDLVSQAEKELSVEQIQILSDRFPDGAQTPEEQLLYDRLVVEMATDPRTSIDDVVEKFKQQRIDILSKGGFDPEDYIVEKDGTVTTPRSKEDSTTIH